MQLYCVTLIYKYETFILILTYEDGGRDITNEMRGAITLDPVSARIILEGSEDIGDLDVPRACPLNLSYPKEVKNAFEVLQKIFFEIDDLKTSPNIMLQKSKLLKKIEE